MELLGLGIRGDQRVVCRGQLAVVLPQPGAGVARKPARPALDLDEEEPLFGKNEQVDLVDAAIVGDEFEVAPGAVGLVGGKPGPYELKCLPFPWITRFCNLDPVHCGRQRFVV